MPFDGFHRVIFILLALFRLPDYGRIGTQSYRAPEVTLGLFCTTAIDMWSFGCCLIELLIGREAFSGPGEIEQLTRTIEVNLQATFCLVLLINHEIELFQYIL